MTRKRLRVQAIARLRMAVNFGEFLGILAALLLVSQTNSASSLDWEGSCRDGLEDTQDCCLELGSNTNSSRVQNHRFLIGLGPFKTGTTFLYNALAMHKDVKGSRIKETHYFSTGRKAVHGSPLNAKYDDYLMNWHPEDLAGGKVLMEFTPDYIVHPGVPCRMKRVIPNAKFVVTLRDPVSRLWSMVTMVRQMCIDKTGQDIVYSIIGHEAGSRLCCDVFMPLPCIVDDSIQQLKAKGCMPGEVTKSWFDCFKDRDAWLNFVGDGLYAMQIAWWFEHFPPEQFIFIRSEDLYKDPLGEVNRVLGFVGDLTLFEQGDFDSKHLMSNSQKYGWLEPDLESVARKLAAFYEIPNGQLVDLLGKHGHVIQPLERGRVRNGEANAGEACGEASRRPKSGRSCESLCCPESMRSHFSRPKPPRTSLWWPVALFGVAFVYSALYLRKKSRQ